VLEWLALPAGVALLLRYAWLLDDAFVYFRYVDNLVHLGHGLVYNAGEYVEGFSSPLWALLLVVLRAAGATWWPTVQVLGVLTWLVAWYLLVALGRRLAPEGARSTGFPVLHLGLHYGVLCYLTSGVETPLVILAAVVYAHFVLSPRSRALQVLVGVSPMLRHELAVPFVLGVVRAWRAGGRAPRALIASFLAAAGGWGLFRVVYYAELLPCTFYLKDEVDVAQGLRYVHDGLAPYHAYLLLPALAAAYVGLRRRGGTGLRGQARLWMLAPAALVTAYVVKIGGDPRHFRFLAYPWVLTVCAAAGLPEGVTHALGARRERVAAPLVGLAIALATLTAYPRQLSRHPLLGGEESEIVDKISDASQHRNHWRISVAPLTRGEKFEIAHLYELYHERTGGFAYHRVVVDLWCFRLYHAFNARVVHSLGLTDPFLARANVPSERPAHKYGLRPLAEDLAAVRRAHLNDPTAEMYREAVEAGTAAPWIAANLSVIEAIARKVHNRHRFWENLRRALTPTGRIDPEAR
jgi:hypothetical protein